MGEGAARQMSLESFVHRHVDGQTTTTKKKTKKKDQRGQRGQRGQRDQGEGEGAPLYLFGGKFYDAAPAALADLGLAAGVIMPAALLDDTASSRPAWCLLGLCLAAPTHPRQSTA